MSFKTSLDIGCFDRQTYRTALASHLSRGA